MSQKQPNNQLYFIVLFQWDCQDDLLIGDGFVSKKKKKNELVITGFIIIDTLYY